MRSRRVLRREAGPESLTCPPITSCCNPKVCLFLFFFWMDLLKEVVFNTDSTTRSSSIIPTGAQFNISLLPICQTAFVLYSVMYNDSGIHTTSRLREKKVGRCSKQCAFNLKFNLNFTWYVLHPDLHWSRIKLVKAEIDSKQNSSGLMRACAGMHPHAHTNRQREHLSFLAPSWSGWHWFRPLSFLPPLCSSSFSCLLSRLPFTVTLCKSSLAEASEPQSVGEFWLSAACGVLCQGSSKCPG